MTPTAVDEVEILRLFGTRLLHYGLDEIEDMAGQVTVEEAQQAWQRIASGASAVVSETEHGIRTARNYLVFRRMAEELGLDAFSIGSYPKCRARCAFPSPGSTRTAFPLAAKGT